MKKITIIFHFICVVLAAASQTLTIESAKMEGAANDASGGIIRSWTPTKALAYYTDGGIGYFSIIDAYSTNMQSSKLPSGYLISDFQIVGDTAYCCGSLNGNGIIMFFDIQDVEAGGSIPMETSEITDISVATKLVAFRNKRMGGVGIAAIGEEHFQDGNVQQTRSYMIDCNNYGTSTFSVSVAKCYQSIDSSEIERLYDLAVTDEYVAFVGIITNRDCISIRRGDVNQLFSSPMISQIHCFSFSGNALIAPLVATSMSQNKLAVASVYAAVTGRFQTQVRLFDLSIMDMYTAQQYDVGGKYAVKDMCYMPYDGSLLLLQESAAVPYYSSVVTLDPTQTAYLTTKFYSLGLEKYQSMDIHDSRFYILADGNRWLIHKKGVFTAPYLCIQREPVNVGTITVNLYYIIGDPVNVIQYSSIPELMSSMEKPCSITCIKYEANQ